MNWYTRHLERDYEGRMSMRMFTEPTELDEFFRDAELVAAKSYQRALGVSFGETRAIAERTLVSRARLVPRVHALRRRSPFAFLHGERYRGRFRFGLRATIRVR